MPDISFVSSSHRGVAGGKSQPATVGRFEMLRQLGQGAQATVWLAQDPRLQRQVAIKLLRMAGARQAPQADQWLHEARLVGRLAHPYIVPLFEADVERGQPYLVFEYVQGRTLAELLRQQGRCTAYDAAALMVDVLDALHAAHTAGVVHRDLKPANIMVDDQRHARVMDFGMAALLQQTTSASTEQPAGTPAYIAPEVLAGAAPSAAMDIYAAGLVLAELLTGRPLVVADTNWQALYQVANHAITLPDSMGSDVDDALRAIIQRALARVPGDRYASALAFKEALQGWITPAASVDTAASHAALDFLLRRMRHKSDFPALSDSVVRIQRVASSDNDSISDLTHEILKDVALTNKLLRMVNSVQFMHANRDSVSTVSRAVSLAGFHAVRNMALSLVLLERMHDKHHADQMLEDFMRAMMAGTVAAELCPTSAEAEEGFLGAMFYNLGRMLCTFYFPEEAQQIRSLVQSSAGAGGEHAAAVQVLGLGFEGLGLGVARVWGLPDSLQRCMSQPQGPVPNKAVPAGAARLQWIAAAANDVATALLFTPPHQLDERLERIDEQYGKALSVDTAEMTAATGRARQKMVAFAHALDIKWSDSSTVARLLVAPSVSPAGSAGAAPVAGGAAGAAGAGGDVSLGSIELKKTTLTPVMSAAQEAGGRQASMGEVAEVLSAGIQDITNAMVQDFQINDIIRMILETMLRALQCRCVVLCLRDPRTNILTGRLGLGEGSDAVLKAMRVPLSVEGDLFAAVCKKGADVLIEDAHESRMQARLPAWYSAQIHAAAFLLLPLQLKGQPFALIYADHHQLHGMVVNDKVLGLLRTLRNQAVMAFRQAGG